MRPKIPLLPLMLGLAGLLPFWALALAKVGGLTFGAAPAGAAQALATYAATIIAFLGGIRWGLAMRVIAPTSDLDAHEAAGLDREHPHPAALSPAYALSVLPQLAAWFSLALPDPWRFALLGLIVLGLGPFDKALVRQGLAPAWFGRLRYGLSLGAGAALFLAALA